MDANCKQRIAADDFFYVIEDSYDESVELAIPFYREMQVELVRALRVKKNAQPWSVLDLGSGTGKTAQQILKNFAVARLDAVDLFDVMHAHAKVRLNEYGSVVDFITGDFMDTEFNGPFDVCASALAIHHQTKEGKRQLFSKIHSSLKPNGIFMMIDWTKFADADLDRLGFENASETVSARIRDKATIANWIEHWRSKNIPDTVENQMAWLREAGFSSVECVVRHWGLAMICAMKSAQSAQ